MKLKRLYLLWFEIWHNILQIINYFFQKMYWQNKMRIKNIMISFSYLSFGRSPENLFIVLFWILVAFTNLRFAFIYIFLISIWNERFCFSEREQNGVLGYKSRQVKVACTYYHINLLFSPQAFLFIFYLTKPLGNSLLSLILCFIFYIYIYIYFFFRFFLSCGLKHNES